MSTPEHEIAIIGAGVSGLGMGAALRRAGIDDFVILERAADVGGTWRDNTYPGVGVDIPTFAYQFSYALRPEWSRFFAKGAEVKQYIDEFVADQELRPRIRFSSEVKARDWDEEKHLWRLTLASGEEVSARFVVSAIGAFVDPRPAEIEGLEFFKGKTLHSARWDHDYELAGKRVALIGTGASAVQILPLIAREVEQLDVYQRTPIWILPKFDPVIPGALKWAFARIPFLQRVVYEVSNAIAEFVLIFVVLNRQRAAFMTRAVEGYARRFLRRSVRDPELRRKLTPTYEFGCKRPSVSNHYLSAFNRDNVELITDPIVRVTPCGVATADGREREVDAIVLATGFQMASDPEIFRRTPVHGRDGFDLATHYEQERLRAYETVSMPRLPNHFMIFGPYGFTGGSWFVLVQTTARHIIRVIEEARRRGATSVEPSEEATARFHAMVDERMARSLWLTGDCATANSYYYDHHGDPAYLRPTSAREARKASRSFPLEDYVFTNGNSIAG